MYDSFHRQKYNQGTAIRELSARKKSSNGHFKCGKWCLRRHTYLASCSRQLRRLAWGSRLHRPPGPVHRAARPPGSAAQRCPCLPGRPYRTWLPPPPVHLHSPHRSVPPSHMNSDAENSAQHCMASHGGLFKTSLMCHAQPPSA
jgi:hypothetical protein